MNRFGSWRPAFERWVSQHALLFAGVVAAVLAGLALLAPVEQRHEALAPSDERARVYFGEAESAGQSFVPLPGLREIRLPVGRRDQEVRSPFILHVRSDYFGEDLRSAAIFNPRPESEEVVFRFEAMADPPPTLLWVLEAPHGPRRAYWVYREHDASAFPDGAAWLTGKPITGNFAFTQVGSQLAYQTWQLNLREHIQPWEWQSFLWLLGVGAAYAALYPWLKGLRLSVRGWVIIMVIATLVLHVWFAQRLPVIIDEGAYLQDAVQTTATFLPLRDFLTKGPIYILLLKAWRTIVPDTLAGWRLLSALAWAGVVAASAALAGRFGLPPKAVILTAALLAGMPGIVAVSTPLLLQVVSTFLAVAALALILKGAQEERPRLIGWGALVLVAGYLIRSSTVAVGVTGLALLLLFAKRRWRAVGLYLLVGGVAMAAVTGIAVLVMGLERAAVMLNLEAVTVGRIQTAQAGGVEPIIRWVTQASTVLWRGGAWFLAGLTLLPFYWAMQRRGFLRLAGVGISAAVLGNVLFHLADIHYGLPGELLVTRWTMLMVVFGIPLLWVLRSWRRGAFRGEGPPGSRWVVVCLIWLAALTLLYRGWGVFRLNYIVEFLPPAAMLSAVALGTALSSWRGRLAQAVVVGLIMASWWQGMAVMMDYPISGTISVEALDRVTRLIRMQVAPHEEIFTAQPVITSAARRAIFRGYSHPGWIRAARLGALPESLRKLYFANDSEITQQLERGVHFVITDDRTNEIYFDDFPERQQILAEQFELVKEVPNDLTEEPFRLYRRK